MATQRTAATAASRTKKPKQKKPVAKTATSTRAAVGVFCACCPDWPIKYPERCSNTQLHGGTIYYFCTKRCKEKFNRNPAAYT